MTNQNIQYSCLYYCHGKKYVEIGNKDNYQLSGLAHSLITNTDMFLEMKEYTIMNILLQLDYTMIAQSYRLP
ncbi:hypothetical protein [Lederbergia citrea]|uniref:Uncharacterized protein n=1 Tax=Lederbergia citrea TaxID=2833581 RepID=A0A942Z5Q3_9BACI|nr:hypothetical protein [Lederbergia citrea]MBS4223186.1 hypothetical protein [Lederbergia citrea]